jgi:cyclophilin family peptidyl-prolyl cis-trans isomerase
MTTSKRQRQKAGRQARLEAARRAQLRAKRNRTIRNVVGGVALLVVVAFLFATLGGGNSKKSVNAGDTTTSIGASSTESTTPGQVVPFAYGTGACAAADGTSPRTLTFALAPQLCIDPTQKYVAVFHTSEGDVTVDLDTTTTPGTTNNFVTLAQYHFYDTTQLFRTDTSIGVIQGGSPSTNTANDPGPGYTIPDEGGAFDFTGSGTGPFTYEAGDLVMARGQGANSGSAQFFFGVDDNVKGLDSQGTYVKFGHVSAGMDVLQAILALNVDDPSSGLGGHPSRTVTISSVEIQVSPAS